MSDEQDTVQNPAFPTGYLGSFSLLVRRPASFFNNLPEKGAFKPALGFLLISATVMALAGAVFQPSASPAPMAVIEWMNAAGMPVVLSIIALLPISILTRRGVGFSRIFAVFAYASGVALPVLWLPAFFVLAESVRWILTGYGLVHFLNLSRAKAFGAIVVTIGLTMALMAALSRLTGGGAV